MAWGFGLLLTLFLVIVSSGTAFRLSPMRFILFAIAITAAWLTSKIGFTEIWSHALPNAWTALRRSWFDWAALIPFGIASVIYAYVPSARKHAREVLLSAAMVTGAGTFGTFNPLQPAQPIFDVPESAFLTKVRKAAEQNPNGWAVVPGMYGALLNGAGISAINHTLTTPQVQFFTKIFPSIPESKIDATFNRYAHIIPSNSVIEPRSPSPDVVLVPVKPFLDPIFGSTGATGDESGQSRQ
jgi:hypothetical protein